MTTATMLAIALATIALSVPVAQMAADVANHQLLTTVADCDVNDPKCPISGSSDSHNQLT